VSRSTREELESLREDGVSPERRRALRESSRAGAQIETLRGGAGIEAILAWVDELRAAFGDPPTNLRPWRGSDFRL
jgi:hypothetical protein